tara:strand:+ start:59 stop:322 length:264 start_codon:yes stop_codon:yes gene_type:complete
MANIASAKKRSRQSEKRRMAKGAQRSALRTAIKRVEKACVSGEKDDALKAYDIAQRKIDSSARKGVIHKNTGARQKKRLVAALKNIG